MPQIDLGLVFAILTWFVYGAIAVYIVVAVGLSMLAARLEIRGGWMAWIPILNLFLLCRMARSSWVWVIPALIPIAGLAVLAYLGARVAKRLGMSGAVGALFGVPFLGALVPIPMALGSAPLPEGSTGGVPARRPIIAGVVSLAVVLILVGMGATAFWITGRMTKTAPLSAKLVAASLPVKTASTLTEFPLDPATTNPSRPTNLITQTFTRPKPGEPAAPQQVKVTEKQLPPWIAPTSLPETVDSLAAADYVSETNTEPVSVVTLVMRDDVSPVLAAPSASMLAKSAPGARATGIEVRNDQGETYRGYRVSAGEATYYALNKTGTNVNVIISATDAPGAETADRLARNLGVGDGLLQDGDYAGLFGELPSAPGGEAWRDVQTFTEADIEKMVRMVEHETANMSAQESKELAAFMPLIKQVRSLAPQRVAFGFTDNGNRGAGAAIVSYGTSRSAWLAFKAAEMVKTLVPIPEEIVIRPVTIGNASGYFVSIRDGGRGYVLRSGSSILGLGASLDMSDDALRAWAEGYVSKK
jgi:hypothetical protein